MGRSARFWSYMVASILLPVFMTGCGKGSSSVTSSTNPAIVYSHSVAFRNTTSLVAWGYNAFGQLGNGDNGGTQQNRPVAVLENGAPIKGVTGFAIGGTHTLVFKNLSTVRAWGNNGFGQLGNGTAYASSTPAKVKNSAGNDFTGVIAVAAGGNHSLAIVEDGSGNKSVWAWGYNGYGQLGDGSLTNRAIPVQVTGITGKIIAVAAGGSHSLAIVEDGSGSTSVWAWGDNHNGQLGKDPTVTAHSAVPLQVTGITGTITKIAAGGSHCLALVTDGSGSTSVWAWGYNFFGQAGVTPPSRQSTLPQYSVTPTVVNGLPASVTEISAGLDHNLALSGGAVWAWGYNGYGQLGSATPPLNTNNPDTTPVPTPVQVTGISGVDSVIAIGHHSLAVIGGRVWAWGDNLYGQLGDGTEGTANTRYNPAVVSGY